MPKCERIRRELLLYAVDGLQGRARERVEEHIRHCSACRTELAALERTGALIGSAGPLSAPRETWPAISAAILARPRPHRRPAARTSWRAALGIVTVLALALAVVFVRPFQPSSPLPLPPAPVAVTVTAEMEADDDDTPVTMESHLSAQWSTPLVDEAAVGLRMADLEGS